MKLKYITGLFALLFIISCGGGGGNTTSSQKLLNIDSAEKAENTLYIISQNTSDLFAIRGWSEIILEELNNQLIEAEEKIATTPYDDVELFCPVKGSMTVNGSILGTDSRTYDISVSMTDCFFDEETGLQGNIDFKGTSENNIAEHMEVAMRDFHIGMYLLIEATSNSTIEFNNIDKSEIILTGIISNRTEDIKYTNFKLSIDENTEGKPQTLDGAFELTRSNALCTVGKYEVSTQRALTNTGSIKVNGATFTYNKDNTVDIGFSDKTITVTGKSKLSCE